MPTGTQTQQTARAGEYYVAAELNRRGLHAVTFTGNMPNIDVMAHHPDRPQHPIYIQVKTKRASAWQTRVGEGYKESDPNSFWILVDLPDVGEPRYYIIPDRRIRAIIKKRYETYPEKFKNKNDQYRLDLRAVSEWEGCWELIERQ